jgi:plasmid stability protein
MSGRTNGRVLCIRFGSDMEPIMATVTLKDLPTDLHRKLKARAEQNGRSLNREVIECLERSFGAERIDVEALIERARRSRASIARTTGSRITQREIDRLKRQGRP